MIYIITRFYDNGVVKAKITSTNTYKEYSSNSLDQYVESIGEGGDYESIKDWCDEMGIDIEDAEDMILNSDTDYWTDISAYC